MLNNRVTRVQNIPHERKQVALFSVADTLVSSQWSVNSFVSGIVWKWRTGEQHGERQMEISQVCMIWFIRDVDWHSLGKCECIQMFRLFL